MLLISSRHRRFCHLLGVVIAATIAGAGIPRSHALTMEASAQLALRNNLELKAAYYEVEKARGRLLQAGLLPNPSLELAGETDRAFKNEGERKFAVAVSQAFPITGRLKHARTVGRVEVALAIAEIRNRERLLIGDVQRVFIQVLAGSEQIAARRELLETTNALVTLSRQRFEAAQVSQVDVNLANIETQKLQQEIRLLEADREANLLALKQKLGLAPQTPLSIEGSLRGVAGSLGAPVDPRRAFSLRPDLRAVELAAERARAEARLASSVAWGDPTVSFGFDQNRRSDVPIGLVTDRSLGLKLSIPLPAFNQNQGKIYEQQSAERLAVGQLSAQRLGVQTEIAVAGERAARIGAALETYERSLLPLISQNTAVLQQGYREGKADFTQILQSQNQRATLRIAAVDLARDRALALVDLQTATASNRLLAPELLRLRRPAIQAEAKR